MPEAFMKVGFMELPDMVAGIAFHGFDQISQVDIGMCFDHVVDVVFVCLHVRNLHLMFSADFCGEPFDIFRYPRRQQLLSVLTNEDYVILQEVFTMSFRFPISHGLSPPFTSHYSRNRQTVKAQLRLACEGRYPSHEAKASGISAHSFK